jgi:hypothetical protein
MDRVADYRNIDFSAEVDELFKHSDFNFGKGSIPIEIAKEAVLKSVCGWHNGSTAQSIITHLGYVIPRHNKKDKLTTKGQAFMWWAFRYTTRNEPKPKAAATSSESTKEASE